MVAAPADVLTGRDWSDGGTAPDDAQTEEDVLIRRALQRVFEGDGAKLLSDASRRAARASLTKRSEEVLAACNEGQFLGETGRRLLNEYQRELVSISRLLAALHKRYVILVRGVGRSVLLDWPDAQSLEPSVLEELSIVDEANFSDDLVDDIEDLDPADEPEDDADDGLERRGDDQGEGGLGVPNLQPEARGWARVRLAVNVGQVFGAHRLRQFVNGRSYWFTTPSDETVRRRPPGARAGKVRV